MPSLVQFFMNKIALAIPHSQKQQGYCGIKPEMITVDEFAWKGKCWLVDGTCEVDMI